MSERDDLRHQQLRIEDTVLLRYHASRHGQNGSEDPEIEEDCAVRRDFKVNKNVRVQHCCYEQNGSKGARHKGDETGNIVSEFNPEKMYTNRMIKARFSLGN